MKTMSQVASIADCAETMDEARAIIAKQDGEIRLLREANSDVRRIALERDAFRESLRAPPVTEVQLRECAKQAQREGFAIGVLQAVVFWEIPAELRAKIESAIAELKSNA